MTEKNDPQNELSDEFRKLGENLAGNLRAIWEHPETRQHREEIKDGLVQIGDTISQVVRDFAESPTGQRIQTGADELGEKMRSGEVQSKTREELIHALSRINAELEKVRARLEETEEGNADTSSP
jgi:predicted nuclease with TOPRIM domain